MQLQLLGPQLLYLNFSSVFAELELWRLLTNLLFFGGFGMPFVFNMFFLVRYSSQLEEQRFAGRSADYLVCLGLCALVLTLAAALMGDQPFLAPALLSSVVYLWARLNPTQPLSIYGIFTVQAFYLPWVLAGMALLMGGSPVPNVLGIVAGHVYYFAADVQHVALGAPRFLCARGRGGAPRGARGRARVGAIDAHRCGAVGGRPAGHIPLRSPPGARLLPRAPFSSPSVCLPPHPLMPSALCAPVCTQPPFQTRSSSPPPSPPVSVRPPLPRRDAIDGAPRGRTPAEAQQRGNFGGGHQWGGGRRLDG